MDAKNDIISILMESPSLARYMQLFIIQGGAKDWAIGHCQKVAKVFQGSVVMCEF